MIWNSFAARRREPNADSWTLVYTVGALYLAVAVAYLAVNW